MPPAPCSTASKCARSPSLYWRRPGSRSASAGTYNILQPAIAGQLRNRKVAAIEAVAPEAVATGNIGCLMQIAGGTELPVVHTVELLDWATGGPLPKALEQAGLSGREAPAEAAEAAE
jgi:glycolate oxidase iron-sulfur subunit